MRDDFDSVLADRCGAVDDVPVPADLWSRVQFKLLDPTPVQFTEDEGPTIDLDAPYPTEKVGLRRRWMLAAAAVLVVVGVAVVLVERDSHEPAVVTTNTPPVSTAPVVVTASTPSDTTTATVESSFVAAIEASGVLISASAEEIALASDTNLYRLDSGSTQVSAANRFLSLRECRTDPACGTGWAYETGSVDGGEVLHGLLGEADQPAVYVLDDRFFVVMEISAYVQGAPTTWLIDSLSGGHAKLTWRDEPTTVSAREQALVVSDGPSSVARFVRLFRSTEAEAERYVPGFFPEVFLPRVVDARDGTIRPLDVPDAASAALPVAQNGNGRIWIGTTPGDNGLGLAFSDDGGVTWTERALPAQLFGNADEPVNADALESVSWGDLLLSIAADGDHIAVTDTWSPDPRDVYVSGDAGLTWSTATVADSKRLENGAHLYVLADKRLLLVRSFDCCPRQLLVSTGSDWTTLEGDFQATRATAGRHVDVNRAGIVSRYYPDGGSSDGDPGDNPEAPFSRHYFSPDLTNWWTIPGLDNRLTE